MCGLESKTGEREKKGHKSVYVLEYEHQQESHHRWKTH